MKDLGMLPDKGEIRLPTEAEWVMAATGGDPARRFPWGPDWNPANSANQDGANRFVAVGLYPANTSPAGAMDMAGNVYEWCLNSYDDLKDWALDREVARATRGGAYYTQPFNRPVSHAQSVFHRFRDNPWGMTRGRNEPGTTRIAAGIRLVYQGPRPEGAEFQVVEG
jgi:formylglycine-generating enzyme required for sulfatase activity